MSLVAAPPPLRWWGWGERDTQVPAGLLALLGEEAGIPGGVVSRPVRLEEVHLPEPALAEPLRRRLVSIAGAAHVRVDAGERVRHAAGRSYLDLLALRSGRTDAAPD